MATHVNVWHKDQLYGRYVVNLSGDMITVKKLAGLNLLAGLLPSLLETANGGFFSIAEEEHKKRTLAWRVVCHSGLSGCKDFYVESCKDSAFMELVRSLPLQISIYDRLNEKFTMWIGDLAPILYGGSYPAWDRTTIKKEGFRLELFYPSWEQYNAPGTGVTGD